MDGRITLPLICGVIFLLTPAAALPQDTRLDDAAPSANSADGPQDEAASPEEPGSLLATVEFPVGLRDIRVMALQNNKQLAVIRYIQEELATSIATAEGRFDTLFGINAFGGESDRQNQSIVESFGTPSNVQTEFFLRPYQDSQIFLQRRNYSGGIARLGYLTTLSDLDPAGDGVFVNPAWDSRIRFRYEQPLLRGAGWEVNEAPIVIARRRTEQSMFDFEAQVYVLLRDVEYAYWDLELAHQLLRILQDFEHTANEILIRERERLELGTGTAPDLAQAEERYTNARIRVTNGEGLVTLAALKLRNIVGLSPVDGQEFVPVEAATQERSYDDLPVAIDKGLGRPEVMAQAAALRAAELQTVIACNDLRPDLNVILDYQVMGLEDTYGRSMRTLGEFDFHEWNVGIQYGRYIHQYAERASVRRAKLAVSRQLARLEQIEHVISYEVADAFERVQYIAAVLDLHRSRTDAAARELEARQSLYMEGRGALDRLLESQDRLVAAESEWRIALRDYQKAITDLKYASGTILEDDIVIEE